MASVLATDPAAPHAMRGSSGAKPNNVTVHRNGSLTRSLLHLASTPHSSCDNKEVTPCHPGHNRPDHHPHRR